MLELGNWLSLVCTVYHSSLEKPVAYDWNHIPVQVVKKKEKEKRVFFSGRQNCVNCQPLFMGLFIEVIIDGSISVKNFFHPLILFHHRSTSNPFYGDLVVSAASTSMLSIVYFGWT